MTPDQKRIVRSTWAQVVPIADTAADLFYDRLFKLDPQIERLFGHTDMTAQKRKLTAAVSQAIADLEHPDTLTRSLEDLGRRHAGYGVEKSHYDTVGSALLWTLERGLGDAWTDDVREAWMQAYGYISSCMIGRAQTA